MMEKGIYKGLEGNYIVILSNEEREKYKTLQEATTNHPKLKYINSGWEI